MPRVALKTDRGRRATLSYDARGVVLHLDAVRVARIDGRSARLVTDADGKPLRLTGVEALPQSLTLRVRDGRPRRLVVAANTDVPLQL